jgi:hypothetical protein
MPAFLGSGGRPNRNGETEQLYRRTPEAVNKNWSGGLSLAMELLPLPDQCRGLFSMPSPQQLLRSVRVHQAVCVGLDEGAPRRSGRAALPASLCA